MKNRGFTLVELLGVIVLLIVIFMLIVPGVNNIINRSKKTTYQTQINTILNAAYDWSLKNSNQLPDENEKIFITLSDLKIEGLVDANIVNPNTKELFNDDLVISITNVGNSYVNNDENAKKNGVYLFKVEEESIQPTNLNKKPTIILEDLTSNSLGNYITTINLNETINEVTYKATSTTGEDLTDRVTVRIMYNDTAVSTIDTTKAGIYHISYTVVDNNGISNSVVRSIIVVDDEKPTLLIPDSITISTNENSFDLMSDVSCTDNSGNCIVTTSGTIEFGKTGKYIIEYSAKDPTGNTTIKRRVITIE